MKTVDLLVIGAGPAGMAAAAEAAGQGASVLVLDEQARPGGQIYRDVDRADAARLEILGPDYAAGRALTGAMAHPQITRQSGVVWDVTADRVVTYSRDGKAHQVRGHQLLIATGALERPVPLPGWTLPGVTTAGAAQILLKSRGLVARDAVIAGSGPLIYLLAAQMVAAGAPPKALIETQGPLLRADVLRHLPGALRGWRGLLKGAGYLSVIRRAGVARYSGASDLKIEGAGQAEQVRFRHRGKDVSLPCDTVLLHQGVVPNTQISRALRLEHRWDDRQMCFRPVLDAWGETGLPGIFIAGDGGGIDGAVAAALAGRIASLQALCQLGKIDAAHRDAQAAPLRRALNREMALRPFLDTLYAPPAEILSPPDEVIVCRCEEVTAGDIRRYAALGCLGPNQTKAFGRPGMGPCQGRYCGLTVTAILAEATGQSHDQTGSYRIRAPLKPVSLGELASLSQELSSTKESTDD